MENIVNTSSYGRRPSGGCIIPPRFEELERAFNGLFQKNPFAFALQHHAKAYKDAEALIWLNGDGKETERLTWCELETLVKKRAYYFVNKLGLKLGDRVLL